MGVLGSVGDFFGKITSGITKVTDDGGDSEELTAISTGMGLPIAIAAWIQSQRKMWGFSPLKSGSSSLYIFILVLGILMAILTGIIVKMVTIVINFFGMGFTGQLRSKPSVIIFCLVVGFVISYFIYILWVKPALEGNNIDVAKTTANSLAVIQSFQNPDPSANEATLMNIQALAVKQAAYIGPREEKGNFDVETGITSELRTGIRFFVLQIDYLEKQKKGFDKPYVPTLLYRRESGELVSFNGARINDVAKSLATYAFSPESTNSEMPLVMYLHFKRTPNALRQPEKYVKFLSQVATDLEPLYPFTVGSSPDGSFQRQQNEKLLLTKPISSFQKKVVYMTNADTSIFRNLSKYGIANIENKYDLDYLVGVRVYLDTEKDHIGVTTSTSGPPPNAVLVPFNRLTALTTAQQDAFAKKHMNTFVITMPPQMENPSLESINTALNHLGVNCIPLNLFGEDMKKLKAKMAAWTGDPFTKLKPVAYRSNGETVGFS
jgi:hypothetical protein